MSPDASTIANPPQLAMVFLLDSSTTLSNMWPSVYGNYITHLFRRYEELHGLPFYIGVVTYGTSDTQPSPLVYRRYFQTSAQVAQDLRVRFANLGLGQTNKTGRRGMAMLDGLVAAMELFEGLVDTKTSQDAWIRFSRHIVHVAACPPDEARHPLHNDNSQLDHITWETIGDELRKRELIWNLVCLQRMPQLAEVHSKAMLGNTSTSWFDVSPNHAVHLAGLPTPDNTSKPRTEPSQSEEDYKRPRVQSMSASDSNAVHHDLATPTVIPPTTSAAITPLVTVSHLPPALLAFANLPQIKALMGGLTMEQIYIINEELKQQMSKVRAAQARNDSAEMEILKKAMQPKMPAYRRATQLMNLYAQMQQAAVGGTGPVASTSTGVSRAPGGQNLPVTHQRTSNTSKTEAVPEPQLNTLTENIKSISPQFSAVVRPAISPAHIAISVQSNDTRLPTKQIWFGTLTWAGVDTSTRARKELRVEVKISSSESSIIEMRADTWPEVLELLPSPEPAVPEEDFRAWVTRLRPCVCVVHADARNIEQAENTHNLESLQRLLKGKPTYALAAWTGPSGAKENMFLLSAFGNNGIVGAFFPNGIKEMPRVTSTSPAVSQLNAQHLLQLQQLQHAQALQNVRSGVPFANPGQAAAAAAAALAIRPPMGMVSGMNPAWLNNNIGPEMLQSFMSRKAPDVANPGS